DADFIAIHQLQRCCGRASATHAVAIDSCERHAREQTFHSLLDPLCALADGLHRPRAHRAHIGCALLCSAVMAQEIQRVSMNSQVSIATLALRCPTAVGTKKYGRVSTSVQEQQHL